MKIKILQDKYMMREDQKADKEMFLKFPKKNMK